MIRRLRDAFLLLFAVSNGYHLFICACRWFSADRHGPVPDLDELFRLERP